MSTCGLPVWSSSSVVRRCGMGDEKKDEVVVETIGGWLAGF